MVPTVCRRIRTSSIAWACSVGALHIRPAPLHTRTPCPPRAQTRFPNPTDVPLDVSRRCIGVAFDDFFNPVKTLFAGLTPAKCPIFPLTPRTQPPAHSPRTPTLRRIRSFPPPPPLVCSQVVWPCLCLPRRLHGGGGGAAGVELSCSLGGVAVWVACLGSTFGIWPVRRSLWSIFRRPCRPTLVFCASRLYVQK